jgi:simple sugar transport system permease protein
VGGIEYLGPAGQLGFSFPQDWGFLGIPIALLAGLNPAGVVPAAIYFGALFAGSDNLARYTTAGPTMIFVIQAVAVLGFVGLSTLRLRRKTAAAGAD